MKKEVIWILNHYSFPDGYGYHTRQHFIAKSLVKLGYDVIIFTSSFNHLKTKDIDLNNQKYLIEKIDEIDYVWIKTREYAGNGLGRGYRDWETDRKSTRLNSSHSGESRMPSSA